jgi:hypothetical protein
MAFCFLVNVNGKLPKTSSLFKSDAIMEKKQVKRYYLQSMTMRQLYLHLNFQFRY